MTDPLLDAPLVQSIGWALLHFIWQGAVIGAATAIALRALAGAAPTTRYLVACPGLALMMLAPVSSVLSASRPGAARAVTLATAAGALVRQFRSLSSLPGR